MPSLASIPSLQAAPRTLAAPVPLSPWSEGWRIGAAIVLGVVMWWAQFVDELPEQRAVVLLDLGVGAGAIITVHWRRRWPVPVALLTALLTAVSVTAVAASLIAFVSLVTLRRWSPVVGTVAIGCVGSFSSAWLSADLSAGLWWAPFVASLVAYGVAVLIGLVVGARRELVASYREAAEREQLARVEQARLNERARIAREMHDVLAHRISLLSLHAGAMTFRTDLSPAELRASAQVVQDNAHQAMLDLRDVLGVLRDPTVRDLDTSGAAPARPQPTLADLPALVQEARDAGTEVQVTGDVLDGPPAPDTVGRTAYRVVQETLTNVRKHAPGAPVSLRLTGHPGGRLDIEVSNPVPAATGSSSETGAGRADEAFLGSGLGLVGLAERATLAGGGLEHGQTRAGDYRVHAWLPWPT